MQHSQTHINDSDGYAPVKEYVLIQEQLQNYL